MQEGGSFGGAHRPGGGPWAPDAPAACLPEGRAGVPRRMSFLAASGHAGDPPTLARRTKVRFVPMGPFFSAQAPFSGYVFSMRRFRRRCPAISSVLAQNVVERTRHRLGAVARHREDSLPLRRGAAMAWPPACWGHGRGMPEPTPVGWAGGHHLRRCFDGQQDDDAEAAGVGGGCGASRLDASGGALGPYECAARGEPGGEGGCSGRSAFNVLCWSWEAVRLERGLGCCGGWCPSVRAGRP